MTESADENLVDVDLVDDLGDLTDGEQFDTDLLPDAGNLDFEQLGSLVEQATDLLESVTEGDDDPSKEKLQALLHLVNLIKGVLKTTDVDDLLDAVELDEVDSVVDLDSVPAALESGELGEAVELKNVRRLIKFGQLWQTVDITELIGSKDEITDTIGQLTGDDEDEGGLLDSGLFEDLEMDDFTGDEDGMKAGLTDPEVMQAATQAQLDSAIDGFRDLLVETHARLDDLREANKQRFSGIDQPKSRNPTAVSTLSTHGGPPKGGSTVSTVPRNVRHSTGPSRRRIYGRRFDRLMAENHSEEADTDEEATMKKEPDADEETPTNNDTPTNNETDADEGVNGDD